MLLSSGSILIFGFNADKKWDKYLGAFLTFCHFLIKLSSTEKVSRTAFHLRGRVPELCTFTTHFSGKGAQLQLRYLRCSQFLIKFSPSKDQQVKVSMPKNFHLINTNMVQTYLPHFPTNW